MPPAASYNNHWGVPADAGPDARFESRYGVFEIGMNHRRRDHAADRAWSGPPSR